MDIEKTKAEFEQSGCFKRFEHVVQYTFFDFGTYCIRTDVPKDVEKKIEKLVSGLIFSWKAWKEAKASAVPDGYVLVEKSKIHTWYQDGDEPENIANSADDIECLGDVLDGDEIMEVNVYESAHISKKTVFGVWKSNSPTDIESNFVLVDTYEEAEEILAANEAMIEAAQEQGHE